MKNNGISSTSPTVLPAAERREDERSETECVGHERSIGGASPLQGLLEATVSQKQLRGTARARGEEAVGELQHRTQVKPREAGLMEASVLGNATPDIQPWSGRYGGRERQEIDRSYSKRSPWVRASGKTGGIENDRSKPKEKSDLLVLATKLVKASGAKGEMD